MPGSILGRVFAASSGKSAPGLRCKQHRFSRSFFAACGSHTMRSARVLTSYITRPIMSNGNDLEARVTAIIIEKLGVDEGDITREASFTNDLGADSLDTVELIMEFEKEFNIAIPDDQAEKIGTVGEAIEYIEKNAK